MAFSLATTQPRVFTDWGLQRTLSFFPRCTCFCALAECLTSTQHWLSYLSLNEPLDVWQARVFEIAAGILKVEGYGALSLPDDLSEIARMLRDGLSEQIEASHSN